MLSLDVAQDRTLLEVLARLAGSVSGRAADGSLNRAVQVSTKGRLATAHPGAVAEKFSDRLYGAAAPLLGGHVLGRVQLRLRRLPLECLRVFQGGVVHGAELVRVLGESRQATGAEGVGVGRALEYGLHTFDEYVDVTRAGVRALQMDDDPVRVDFEAVGRVLEDLHELGLGLHQFAVGTLEQVGDALSLGHRVLEFTGRPRDEGLRDAGVLALPGRPLCIDAHVPGVLGELPQLLGHGNPVVDCRIERFRPEIQKLLEGQHGAPRSDEEGADGEQRRIT
ncbi:hypothetical protein EES40_36940 [Streptomyces sp. ADI93-02]|nr:hypothetical protein EES40_36940 [Streptomyces sp. ADI93-02]